MSNPYFDPETCPFEVKGFFEEFIEPHTGKTIGHRHVPQPDRPLGSDGMIEVSLIANHMLRKGRHLIVVKASPQKPIHAIAMIQIICGHLKSNLKAHQEGTFYPQDPNKFEVATRPRNP